MPPRRPTSWIARPGLEAQLSSDAAVVAVCGPRAAGKSTLLAAWAAERTDVVWHDAEVALALASPPDNGILVIDDADGLAPDDWRELDRRLRAAPALRARVAVRSGAVLPATLDAEVLDDLALTAAEVGEHLAAAGSTADPELCAAATGGLVGAVRLVARSAATTAPQMAAALARHRDTVLPPQARELAVPEHLSAGVVAALGGDPGFLDDAEAAGWGRWHTSPAGRTFQLTALVRLPSRAALGWPESREAELRGRAAEVLLDELNTFGALVEAVAAHRLDLVDAALKDGGIPLLWDHGYAVARALDQLPALALRRYPVVAFARALTLNSRRAHRLRAVEYFSLALVGARTLPKGSADRTIMRVVESVGRRLLHVGDSGLKAARDAALTMTEMPLADREHLRALEPDLHLHTGLSLMYGGALTEACAELERSITGRARTGARLQGLGALALIQAVTGDVPQAKRWLATASEHVWPEALLRGYAGSMLRVAQAQVAVEDLRFDEAAAHLDDIWAQAETIEHWPLLVHVRAQVALGRGRAGEGLEMLRAVSAQRGYRSGTGSALHRALLGTELVLLVASGDLEGARRVPVRRDDAASVRLEHARVALVDGATDRALELVSRAEARTPRERVTRASLQAVLLHRMGQDAAAREHADRLGVLVSTYGARSPLMAVPAADRAVLGDVLVGVPSVVDATRHVPALTPRERVVLDHLVATSSVDVIAQTLNVSVNTVKSQRRALYQKLGARSRDDALAAALAHGLLD